MQKPSFHRSCLSSASHIAVSSYANLPSCLVQRRWQTYGTGPGATCFGGQRATETNSRLLRLPQKIEDDEERRKTEKKNLDFCKFPGAVAKLGGRYFFREGQLHEGQRMYHMKTRGTAVKDEKGVLTYEGGIDEVYVGSVEREKRETKAIENALYEDTRGFAIQLLMEGRGVRIFLRLMKIEFEFLFRHLF